MRNDGDSMEKWLRVLKLYLVAKGDADDKQQTVVMLHSRVMALQDIFYSLVTQNEADNKTFTQSIDIFDKHFTPVLNVPFERLLFRQLQQQPEEIVDQFVARFRQRAPNWLYRCRRGHTWPTYW